MRAKSVAAIWLIAAAASAITFRLVDVSSHSASDTLIGFVPISAGICCLAALATAGVKRASRWR